MFTKEEIINQLEKMNAPRNSVVLMHSSMRAVGKVEGGVRGLLDILIEYFTSEGGLFCVPTHTWRNLGKDKPTLDMSLCESNVGAFSVVALESGLGVRSENPTHSMVVFGDKNKAEEFVKDEARITSPTPKDGCHGKLFDQDGYVLLVGVGQERNTYLHCVGEMLGLPNRMLVNEKKKMTVKRANGEIVERELAWYDFETNGDVSTKFPKYDVAFRYHGCITDGFIGNAPAQLCSARLMKETVELIFKNSEGVDPLATIRPIQPKWYCNK